MKLAFICSPYAKLDIDDALYYAQDLAHSALSDGYIPISPILAFHKVMFEKTPQEREQVIKVCHELLKRCDVVYVLESSYGITSGMQGEIDLANKLGTPIISRPINNPFAAHNNNPEG